MRTCNQVTWQISVTQHIMKSCCSWYIKWVLSPDWPMPSVLFSHPFFLTLSILDILLPSLSYIEKILANFPPFITVPEASRCCVSSVKNISLSKLHLARCFAGEKANRTFCNFMLCFATLIYVLNFIFYLSTW